MSAAPEFRKSSSCGGGSCVEVAFQRSSFCGSSACVEVARTADRVQVRDADGQQVSYDFDEWRAFLAGVRDGEFDV
jgi:hypothetical protein